MGADHFVTVGNPLVVLTPPILISGESFCSRCAILFIFFLGGTGGWISFAVAAFVIFLIAVVTMDKIK